MIMERRANKMDESSNSTCSSGNNIELVTTHKQKIDKIRKGIPESVLRLFGVLPKNKKKEDA